MVAGSSKKQNTTHTYGNNNKEKKEKNNIQLWTWKSNHNIFFFLQHFPADFQQPFLIMVTHKWRRSMHFHDFP